MEEEMLRKMFANPFYAVTIAPTLLGEHEPMVSEEEWVTVNAKRIREEGAEEWLRLLLDVLKTGGVNRDDAETRG